MKQILVYMDSNSLAPKGGPIGYCYNIQQEVIAQECDNIHFLNESELVKSERKDFSYKLKGWMKTHFFCLYNYLSLKRSIIKPVIQHPKEYLNKYDVIHFHNTIQLYQNRKELENFNGIVIITSHSPIPYHMELLELLRNHKDYFLFSHFFRKVSEFDRYAYNRANVIIFPCKEAEESYLKHWSAYKDIHDANKEKYRYLLTGIRNCIAKNSAKDIREKYKIPNDAFLISYVGRHNSVKGYDNLKEMGRELLSDETKYVIVAGKEDPIKRLDHPRWKEIGWTDDAYSIISASDVFILPNRETYFDIVFLEVLSLGRIIVASNVGGNKVFKDKSSGIFLYDNLEEAIKIVESISKMTVEQRGLMERENRKLFEKEFDSSVFLDNYLRLIEDLA